MTLVDQDARSRIAEATGEALFVEAGAGTGKTTSLVARVVTLVAQADVLPSIAGLAAITFTENAASELRTRIRAELTEARNDPTRPDEQRERCAAALEQLDDAAITTLHGFAGRLLADHPLEAGLPPGFGVLDAVRAGLDADRWWSDLVDTMLDEPALREVWRTAMTLGLLPGNLRDVATAFAGNWDLLPSTPLSTGAVPPWATADVVAALRDVVDRYADAAPLDDGLGTHLREVLRPALADVAAEDDELGRAAVLAGLSLSSTLGKADAWKKVGLRKPDVVAALKDVQDLRDAQLDAVRTGCLAVLLERLRVAVLAEVERRRDDGQLHFHDLLVHARDLLRDDDGARRALSARWPVVLVDEFQDTDPLQAELVHLLTATEVPSAWSEADVAPHRLFFVGDPKQSIYRFRRADVALYRQVQDRTGAGRVQLVQNFRSRPGVLDAVNAALEPLMLAGAPDQVPYGPLVAERAAVPDDSGPDVLLLGGPHEQPMAEVRSREAEHVAATCRRAKDDGWLVVRGKETGPVRFSDIALLVPTRTSLGAVEDALQAYDVPYRIESRSLVWATDAVRDLLTLLEAVDDPGDAVAVAATLRHPGFACSDDDLIAWRAGGGSWSYLVDPPEALAASPVAQGLAALRRYHELRWWLPVNQLLDQVVRERRLVELTAALPRPRDHWRRLRFLQDQARAFLDAGGAGVGEFVRWARQQAESGADAIESAVPEPDDDAVRILTVHASKGLEFPVVVLTGINVDDTTRGQVWWTADGPVVKVKEFASPGYAEARAVEARLNEAEAVRVLYVGATRARDHLVVSLHHKKAGKPRNHAGRLHALLDALGGAGAVHEAALGEASAAVPQAAAQADLSGLARSHATFVADRRALLEEVHLRLPVTATGLARAEAATREAAEQEPADDLASLPSTAPDDVPAPRHAAGQGATLGSIVHRVLELVDLPDPRPEQVHACAVTAALENGAPALAAAAEQRARAALASPLLQGVAEGAHWKEVPVVALVDDRYLEGYVDLVLAREDGLVVVDYKTDRASSDAELAAKAEGYGPQLRAYARAVALATGRPVVAALLLFVGTSSATQVEVPLV